MRWRLNVLKVLKTIFLTLLFILGITFSMENTGWVVLRYYFGFETPPVPLFLLVLFSILLGILLAVIRRRPNSALDPSASA